MLIIGSFPLNTMSFARCLAMKRIFKDRNIVVSLQNYTKPTIQELLNEKEIIHKWNIEYLQVPRAIDVEFMEEDYDRYVKMFLDKSLGDT